MIWLEKRKLTWKIDSTPSTGLDADWPSRILSKTLDETRLSDAMKMFRSGYCRWRDQKKPSEILAILCKKWGTEEPVYSEKCVTVNGKKFAAVDVKSKSLRHNRCTYDPVRKRHWCLVLIFFLDFFVYRMIQIYRHALGIQNSATIFWLCLF